MAPVDPVSLANPELRREWQTTRNMKVFSFWDTTNTRPTVDVMLAPVVSFDELWADAALTSIGGVEVRIASVRHLIRMKEAAGRPQDLADLERLRAKLLDWGGPTPRRKICGTSIRTRSRAPGVPGKTRRR